MKERLIVLSVASTIVLLSLGLLFRELNTPVTPPVAVQSATKSNELPLTRENLLRLVNEERAKVGVSPLAMDSMLNQSAQWKADDMQTHGYRGHVKPGETSSNGLVYLDRLNTVNPKCSNVSENLSWIPAGSSLSATDAVKSWKDSESHYAAMVDPKNVATGFGIHTDSAVQHLCKPL